MEHDYRDRNGRRMTREEVHQLPADQLSVRSGIAVRILPDTAAL